MTSFVHSGECAYDSTHFAARQTIHAHAAAVAPPRCWRQANRVRMVAGGVDETSAERQGGSVNMPVIIATGPQQRGVQRGYAILEFKELGSQERHKTWKLSLAVYHDYQKRKNHERRHN